MVALVPWLITCPCIMVTVKGLLWLTIGQFKQLNNRYLERCSIAKCKNTSFSTVGIGLDSMAPKNVIKITVDNASLADNNYLIAARATSAYQKNFRVFIFNIKGRYLNASFMAILSSPNKYDIDHIQFVSPLGEIDYTAECFCEFVPLPTPVMCYKENPSPRTMCFTIMHRHKPLREQIYDIRFCHVSVSGRSSLGRLIADHYTFTFYKLLYDQD